MKEAYAALESATAEKNKSGVLLALDQFLAAFGKRADLIIALGINQSTWTRWKQGQGLGGLTRQLIRFRQLVGKDENTFPRSLALPSEAMLQAIVATKNSSLDGLQMLLRMREAAGFDLSVELYEKLIKEFELQKS
ncbi:MAG: hypothetical protein WEC81_01425 [Patescibacteria group bacterium]